MKFFQGQESFLCKEGLLLHSDMSEKTEEQAYYSLHRLFKKFIYKFKVQITGIQVNPTPGFESVQGLTTIVIYSAQSGVT